jgi:hypothetical protein
LGVEECASLDSAERGKNFLRIFSEFLADLENSLKTVENGVIVDASTQSWIAHSELEFLKKLGEGNYQ